jgi:hypothetical protein
LLSGLYTVPPEPPALFTAAPKTKSICPFVLSFVGKADAGVAPPIRIVPTRERVSAARRLRRAGRVRRVGPGRRARAVERWGSGIPHRIPDTADDARAGGTGIMQRRAVHRLLDLSADRDDPGVRHPSQHGLPRIGSS